MNITINLLSVIPAVLAAVILWLVVTLHARVETRWPRVATAIMALIALFCWWGINDVLRRIMEVWR